MDSRVEVVEFGSIENIMQISLPIVSSSVQAGFPSCADEYIDKRLDLNKLMIKHPAATFFVRVHGDSMKDAGIHSGDILVVDRALTPTTGKIVVAVIAGEFTVKRLQLGQGSISLKAENPLYPTMKITEGQEDFQIWGVVTYVIHKAE
jgi:DNA polymerase V